MRTFFILFLFIFVSQSCTAKELYTGADNDIYGIVKNLEMKIYSRDYSQENIYPRVERLEHSIYGSSLKGSIYDRIDRIKNSVNSGESQRSNLSQQVFLELLENRYLGVTYNNDSVENRLSRLETCMLGKKLSGNIDTRFNSLLQKVPVSILGVSITDNDGKMSVNPELSDKSQYSILSNTKYVPSEGEYLSNVAKSFNNKILRWNDFPVYIYIEKSTPSNMQAAKNAVKIWNSYIPINLTESIYDAQIVISWRNNNFITEPFLAQYKDEIVYRVLIYGDYSKEPDLKSKLLVHQIGHALGIWGHSDNPKDIMFDFSEIKSDIKQNNFEIQDASIKSAPSEPSVRDINTLIKIYRMPSSSYNIVE